MGKSKHNDYSHEPKDGEKAKLKRHIHHLEKEIKRLKSELRTYEKALATNVVFLKEKTKNLTLEELIQGAQEELNLQQIKEVKIDKFEEMKQKWACFECNVGIMKFISFPKGPEIYYFRKCSNPRCNHRTEGKLLTEEVDKGV